MIFDAAALAPGHLDADLVVVGSGPGGATAARAAAEAGLRVVVLESGGLVTPSDATQREEEMLPRLFRLAGTMTTRDRAVRIHQGMGVGGSSLHNLNLIKRVPEALRARWSEARGLAHLPPARWAELYDALEAELEVKAVPRADWNPHNRLLEAACQALGWRGGGLSHNRSGCIGSGFCALGCAYDAKNNALKVMVPPLIEAGGQILVHAHALRIVHDGRRVTGVDAMALDPHSREPVGRLDVRAPRVCVAASATGTPALLERSKVPDPSGTTGRGLRVHPAVTVAAELDAPVRAWEGIPQTYECTEWLDFEGEDRRLWIVPAFAHPMATATLLPGLGAEHRGLMERYARLGVLTAMLHDHTAGTVRARGPMGVDVDYWPDAADRAQLVEGLVRAAELWFAAGARRVFVPGRRLITLERGEDPATLRALQLEPGAIDLTAVHPMASVPMGDDPATAAVGSDGRHHHLAGLWIADGSLFPGSIGVPPQLSIYALGRHVGQALAAAG
jgi:choline dehydrogenase-like flavoprotein